jgi:hypothetical protein
MNILLKKVKKYDLHVTSTAGGSRNLGHPGELGVWGKGGGAGGPPPPPHPG